jgi:tetratricopeptide (TPR) repeat protein
MMSKKLAILAVLLIGAGVAGAAEDRQTARDHYIKGTRLFDLGRFDDAIKEYEAAYEIKDDPVLLYNIAQAHRLAGHSQQALFYYKSFLRRAPKTPNRVEVETKVAELEKLIEQQAKTQTMPPDFPIPPRGERTALGAMAVPGSTKPGKQPAKPGTPPLTANVTPTEPEPTEPAVKPGQPESHPAAATAVAAAQKPDEKKKDDDKTPVYKKWWFWTAIGGVIVAGAVVGGAVAATQPSFTMSSDCRFGVGNPNCAH